MRPLPILPCRAAWGETPKGVLFLRKPQLAEETTLQSGAPSHLSRRLRMPNLQSSAHMTYDPSTQTTVLPVRAAKDCRTRCHPARREDGQPSPRSLTITTAMLRQMRRLTATGCKFTIFASLMPTVIPYTGRPHELKRLFVI